MTRSNNSQRNVHQAKNLAGAVLAAGGVCALLAALFFSFARGGTSAAAQEQKPPPVSVADAGRAAPPALAVSEPHPGSAKHRHEVVTEEPSDPLSQADGGLADAWGVSIHLISSDNRLPISGAKVVFDGVLAPHSGNSDERGSIEVSAVLPPAEVLPSPDCTAWFQAPGFTPKRVDRFISSHSSGSVIEVELIRDASLEVEVRDPHGEPVEGVIVRVQRETGLGQPDPWLDQGTGKSGLTLRVSIGGGRGRVLEESEDRAWNAKTGLQGVARFDGLPAREPLVLQVSRAGTILASKDEVMLSPAGRTVETLSVSLATGLKGVVEDWHTGERLSGIVLNLYRGSVAGGGDFGLETYALAETLPSRRVVSQQDGSFEVAGLFEGVWYVGPASGEASWQPRDLKPSLVAYRVELPLDPSEPHFVLRVQRGTYVAGVVVDSNGLPREGVTVSVRGEGDSGAGVSALSNEDGEFEIGPLNSEPLELRARAVPGLAPPPAQQVIPGDHAVFVQMQQSTGIHVQLASEAGEPAELRRITASRGGVILHQVDLGDSGSNTHVVEGLGSEPIDLFVEGVGGALGVLEGAEPRPGPAFASCTVPMVASGTLVLENGDDLSGTQTRVFSSGVPVAIMEVGAGRSLEISVPSGNVRVLSLVGGDWLEQEVTVAPSGEAELSLTR